ncbi:Uncharacterised protein [Catenibacterium mitsuokai]|nr:hypothetical protein [Catenibacterium mitsuokai]CUO56981.1 Uncharacterised protein [Catenibacterium mitsuokai]
MKTNEEKMNEELSELFMNYEKERKRIENEIKDNLNTHNLQVTI